MKKTNQEIATMLSIEERIVLRQFWQYEDDGPTLTQEEWESLGGLEVDLNAKAEPVLKMLEGLGLLMTHDGLTYKITDAGIKVARLIRAAHSW